MSTSSSRSSEHAAAASPTPRIAARRRRRAPTSSAAAPAQQQPPSAAAAAARPCSRPAPAASPDTPACAPRVKADWRIRVVSTTGGSQPLASLQQLFLATDQVICQLLLSAWQSKPTHAGAVAETLWLITFSQPLLSIRQHHTLFPADQDRRHWAASAAQS